MLTCAICEHPFPFHRPCDQTHEGVCHDCASRNFHGNPLDYRAHEAPREPPTLTTRAQAAVAAYQAHVVRVMGAAPLVEDEP